MKTTFPGYFRPTDEAFESLWRGCTFVLDANVLLNTYGYSAPTRKSLLLILRGIADRIWIPHQFAKEYLKNRPKAVKEQIQNYISVQNSLKTLLEKDFRSKKKHPFVSPKFVTQLERLCDHLERGRKEHAKMLTHDDLFEEISNLFSGKVGGEPAPEQLSALYELARPRYLKKDPPGFMDEKKGEPECFGDFIGWSQILDYAESNNRSVIFVTDDRKDDWWLVHGSDTIGPRPELVKEFRIRAKNDFYMYNLEQFMRFSALYLGSKIAKGALDEIREQSASLLEDKHSGRGSKYEQNTSPLCLTSNETPKAASSPDANQASSGSTAPKSVM